jgi:glycerol-3-phosphate dehydrogenase (NAD(P)+)
MKSPSKSQPVVTVLGAGTWGTTVAHLIARNGHPVNLWCRRKKQATEINKKHTNAQYLHDLKVSPEVTATTDLGYAVSEAALVLIIIPSKAFRSVCREAAPFIEPNQLVVHGTKGLEPESNKRMSQIIVEETCARQIGVLSGPNIAREICMDLPAGVVIASPFPRVQKVVEEFVMSEHMRVYANKDVVGVEIAGALKNIVAIGSGILAHLGLGENVRSLLITRGLSEIARVGVALGADPMTFFGVAGMGDLIVTCMSPHSRNFQVGVALAQGKELERFLEELGMVAEGVRTAPVAWAIAQEHDVDAPLLDCMCKILNGTYSVQEAIVHLMRLSSRHDIDQALR